MIELNSNCVETFPRIASAGTVVRNITGRTNVKSVRKNGGYAEMG